MSPPRVSIVLVTLNGGPLLGRVLDGIRAQRVELPPEVVAVDSGSSDGTVERLQEAGARVVAIPRADFNHGQTRNLGVAQAKGEWVVLMTQDAVPADEHWLEALVTPLAADARVAGSFSRQVPRADASALTRRGIERWVAGQPEGRTVELSAAGFSRAQPFERYLQCVFDNVCSCVRRSVWEQHPFPETPIAEDIEWAREVLLAGHRIAYAPVSRVIHSHERSVAYELKRTYLTHRRFHALFGLSTIPNAPRLAQSIGRTLVGHARGLLDEPGLNVHEVLRVMGLAVAWPLGQYLGALSDRRGWPDVRMRGV